MLSSKVENWKSKKGIDWLPLQSHTRRLILCHYLFLMIHTASQFSANELLIYKTKERFISIDIPSYIERRYSTMGKRPLISPRSPKIDWNENVQSHWVSSATLELKKVRQYATSRNSSHRIQRSGRQGNYKSFLMFWNSMTLKSESSTFFVAKWWGQRVGCLAMMSFLGKCTFWIP